MIYKIHTVAKHNDRYHNYSVSKVVVVGLLDVAHYKMYRDNTSDSGLPPLAKLQAGIFTTFRVEPVLIRMAIYARHETGDYDELFESIELTTFKFDFPAKLLIFPGP
jgi:hypothetical protein